MTTLILTSIEDSTADYLCGRLDRVGMEYLRLDTDSDISQVRVSYSKSVPLLQIRDLQFRPADFANIWYRRPKPIRVKIDADEAEGRQILCEWREAIEGFLAHLPVSSWVNHPSNNALASHKLEQLSRARRFDLHVPATILTQDEVALLDFWAECKERIIVKPLASGYIERADPQDDSQIYTNVVTQSDMGDLAALAACPTLFQQQIEKDFDVRITLVGATLTAVAMRAKDQGQQRVDIRRNNMADVAYSRVELPQGITKCLLAYLESYSLKFAAVDMVVDLEGNWWFLEVNPNGQWAWLDLAGAADIGQCFLNLFQQSQRSNVLA
jgi:hypothetical protein